ncbi:hypothetical protein KP509_29G000700 [Ceratopteris richardii]|uniref:Alkyl transferase n=1 Tax=Ceratopteris richardii TaxID=49495 RepID=A0A8T2R567_CERRI|nr:hypothetical protein KP509_29G000700 [Ceratopteris richardii]
MSASSSLSSPFRGHGPLFDTSIPVLRRCHGYTLSKVVNPLQVISSEKSHFYARRTFEVRSEIFYSHTAEHPSTLADAYPSCRQLPHGLDSLLLPRHVAIIMDGNSRWAERRGLSRAAGHEAGSRSLKKIVQLSCEWGISALTVFAFSMENWERGEVEISILMQLFQKVLIEELDNFVKENIQVRFIGDMQRLPSPLQSLIQKVQQKTSENTGLKLTVATSYSGRHDIIQACQHIATNVQQGKLSPQDITEDCLDEHLGTSWIGDIRNPDLLIRTSGEQRLSNFLLWQLAYTELFFIDAMWPDIDENLYAGALLYYQMRSRRYGRRPGV